MKVTNQATLEATLHFELPEKEARALMAMFTYGPEAYLRGFYAQLGRHYLEPHAQAVPGLFDAVQKQLGPQLTRCDKARKSFCEPI